MKKKQFAIKTGSLFFAMLFCFLCTVTSVSATEVESRCKISQELAEILSRASDTDLVPLSIWFYDIDESIVADNTIDKIDALIGDAKLPSSSIDTIDQLTAKIDTSDIDLSVEQVQLISSTKRNLSKELYTDYNAVKLNGIISKLDNYNIIYICSYAPNIVLETPKSEIYKLENETNISDIYYYDLDALDVNTYANETTTNGVDLDDCR